jgi:hypothetical protein
MPWEPYKPPRSELQPLDMTASGRETGFSSRWLGAIEILGGVAIIAAGCWSTAYVAGFEVGFVMLILPGIWLRFRTPFRWAGQILPLALAAFAVHEMIRSSRP